MTFPHLRSLFSKAVPADKQGRLFAVVSAIETLSTTITPIIVAPVFKHTADHFVGAVWLVMVAFVSMAASILYLVYILSISPKDRHHHMGQDSLENGFCSNTNHHGIDRKDSSDLTSRLLNGSSVEQLVDPTADGDLFSDRSSRSSSSGSDNIGDSPAHSSVERRRLNTFELIKSG